MHEKLGHQLPASDDFCQFGCIFEGASLLTKNFQLSLFAQCIAWQYDFHLE